MNKCHRVLKNIENLLNSSKIDLGYYMRLIIIHGLSHCTKSVHTLFGKEMPVDNLKIVCIHKHIIILLYIVLASIWWN